MQTLTKEQKIAVKLLAIVMIFAGGTLFGTSLTKTPEKVVERVEVEKNREEWRELKAIDDELIKIAVGNSELCAGAFYAISNGDAGTLQAVLAEQKELNQKFDTAAKARSNVTKALGY